MRNLLERLGLTRALLDVAFDGIVVSQDGMVTDVSQRLLDVSGYTLEDVVGQPVTVFIAEPYREQVRLRVERREEGRYDSSVVIKDGRMFPVEAASMHVLVDGRDTRITALRDATEKRHLEVRLRHAHQLEVVGRLAAGVAHDFNNLLTIIRAYSGLLQDSVSAPERDDVQAILDAAESGEALTRELLSYGRPRSNTPVPVDITTVVRGCERLIPAILGRNILYTALLTADIGPVSSDPVELQQLLLNLVVNARDAMPNGGRLMIRTRRVDVSEAQSRTDGARPGPYAMLGVSDSGTGIPDDVRARIFEPFFSTKDPGRGSGLGLSRVKEIVDAAGGFITVQSAVHLGTVICIHLPIVRDETGSLPNA